MSEPFWTDAAFDFVILGSNTLPGLCEIEGLEVGEDIEVTKTKGENGATIKDQGKDPAEFSIIVTLVTRQHWDEWQTVLPKIHPRRKDATAKAFQIIHPDVNLVGITEVLVKSLATQHATKGGAKRITIKVIEWFATPVKKKAATQAGKSAAAEKAQALSRVEELTKQAAFDMVMTDAGALNRAMGLPQPSGKPPSDSTF